MTRAFVIFRSLNSSFSLSSTTILHAQCAVALASSKYNLLRNPAPLRRSQYLGGALAGGERRRRHIVQNRRERGQGATSRQPACAQRNLLNLAVYRSVLSHFRVPPCGETHAHRSVARHFFIEFRLRKEVQKV